ACRPSRSTRSAPSPISLLRISAWLPRRIRRPRSSRMHRAFLFCVLALTLATTAAAQRKKPPLPPGRDPGGVAIALLGSGIDYTVPHIAQRLARDGEGELIGFDLVDNDNRPLGGDGTALATNLLDPTIGARLVPVR